RPRQRRRDLPLRPRRADGRVAAGRRGAGGMSGMLLVVVLAGRRAVLPADQVNSVIELDAVTPVPRAAPHVVGLAALRSRPLTVIDCCVSLGVEVTDDAGARRAVVVEHDGHLYGLLVDS